jgi:hypothetical protein
MISDHYLAFFEERSTDIGPSVTFHTYNWILRNAQTRLLRRTTHSRRRSSGLSTGATRTSRYTSRSKVRHAARSLVGTDNETALPHVVTVFDVLLKCNVYGKGGSHSQFSGKDASRALGLSSLKPEDAVPDWSTLEEMDRRTLNDWHTFFMCVAFLSLSPLLQRD